MKKKDDENGNGEGSRYLPIFCIDFAIEIPKLAEVSGYYSKSLRIQIYAV